MLVSFCLGILTSTIVGYGIYLRQKKDNEEHERQNFLLLQKNLNLSQETSVSVEDIAKTQKELCSEVYHLREKLTVALAESNLPQATALSVQYINAAGAIAEKRIKELPASMPKFTNLTLDLLLKVHRSLFPPKYEFAGKLRKAQVCIYDSSHQKLRFMPPPAKDVPELLEKMLGWWNNKINEIKDSPTNKKIEAVSSFHHRFLSIHPFIDGNGKTARLLLKLQIKELLQKNINVEFPKQEYYEALLYADKENRKKLDDLINTLIANN